MAKIRWSAFPSTRSTKIWISSNDHVKDALKLYNPYSRAGKFVKLLFSHTPEFIARLLLPTLSNPQTINHLHNLTTRIEQALGRHIKTISFSVGTPGPHQKFTAQILEHRKVLAYAKIGETPAARHLIEQETDVLYSLNKQKHFPFKIPSVIGSLNSESCSILVQSAPSKKMFPRAITLNGADLNAMTSLARTSEGETTINEIINNRFESLIQSSNPKIKNNTSLENALNFLQDIFSNEKVRTHFAHGDHAPWNSATLSNGEHYIFDWEYGETNAPALNDLIHYIFMPIKLIQQRTARHSIQQLFQTLNTNRCCEFYDLLNIPHDKLIAYVLLYLLHIAARDVQHTQTIDPFILDCIHMTLIKSASSNEPIKVLVSTYACEPNEGSEPGVGWNMVQAISKHNEAWVITRKNNKSVIEAELSTSPNPRLHFIYTDVPKWASFWKKGGRGVRTYYYLWQWCAWTEARKLVREVHFDLGHHITFVSDWLFTFQCLLPHPYIWGPIGSNPLAPSQLAFSRRAWFMDRARYAFQFVMRIVDPLFWISTLRANRVIGIEASVKTRLPFSLLNNDRFTTHTAIGVEQLPPIIESTGNSPDASFTILSVGKFLPIKGFHLTLLAFAELVKEVPDANLSIIGDGAIKDRLVALTQQLGISDKVKFQGMLPRQEVLDAMRHADVFLFPSFEGAGMVILEAMASQLPVVCLDFGGPGQMVPDNCGYRAMVGNKKDTIRELGQALIRYANNRSQTREHGANARVYVESQYLWSNRPQIIQRWYQHLLDN